MATIQQELLLTQHITLLLVAFFASVAIFNCAFITSTEFASLVLIT